MEDNNSISPEEQDLIEKFLHDALTDEDRVAFTSKENSDPQWQDKIKERQLLILGIQEAALQQKLDDFHQEVSSPVIQMAPPKVNRGWWLAAASVVAVAAIAGLLLLGKPQNEKLFAAYYKPDPGLPVVMGEGNTDNYTLYDGMIDYKEDNYNAALQKWKRIGDKSGYTDTLNYYIGIANLNTGKLSNAIDFLNKVRTDEKSPYRQKATWYQALTYLKQNDKQTAAELLKELGTFPGARELLSEIK